MKSTIIALSAFFLSVFATFADAQTAENPNYPVLIVDSQNGVIAIAGEIDLRTPLAFERTLSAVPNASVLVLDSPGGLVHSALSIASRVRGLGLTTVVPDGSECLSACALVFFAGTQRTALGDLGVHQISGSDGRGDLVGGQFALADVVEALNEYDVPPELVGLMLRTPPRDMYIFSPEEKRRFGFLSQRQSFAERSNIPPTGVDLLDPETWRGNVVTGQIISTGKKWFAALNPDGTTTFQFASGQRSSGSYYISERRVCFKLGEASEFDCRRPLQGPSGVRWYDESGNYQSIIVKVDDSKFASIEPAKTSTTKISEHILPGDCALIVASRPTVAAAQEYVRESISDRRFLKAFRSKNGWIAISIGTLEPEEVDLVIADWKKAGRIPADSYCSTGANYLEVIDLGFG